MTVKTIADILTAMANVTLPIDKRKPKTAGAGVSIVSIAALCILGAVAVLSAWNRAVVFDRDVLWVRPNPEAKCNCDAQSSPQHVSEKTPSLGVAAKTTMQLLSQPQTFFPTVTALYERYGKEIAAFRPEMRAWCQKTDSCKFCDYEAEMLYLLVRDTKPQKVFEMAPNRGYSSHWILKALTMNDETSKLHSFDIHDNSVKYMTERFHRRWTFTKGDYAALLRTGELQLAGFDFLFIDALHEEEFSRGYCRDILDAHRERAVVAIHDIVANKLGGGRESAEVYKWMAYATHKVRSVFTMSPFVAPNMNFPMVDYVEKLNELRVRMGIIVPCAPTCNDSRHDVLYFEQGDSPAIFFELN